MYGTAVSFQSFMLFLYTSAFSCTDHHMKKGKLFLSEGYLCFDTHFSLGENKVVLPIKRIFEVVKV